MERIPRAIYTKELREEAVKMVTKGGNNMKKANQIFLFSLFCLGLIAILVPSYSTAFPSIKLGEESEITFYGFFRNNLGMFLQNQPYAHSGNDLATARTWFRGYGEFKITNQFRVWTAIQFVYEPEYRVEKGALSSLTPTQFGNSIRRRGGEYSEYRNINDILREAFIEWKPSREHSIRVGRQIAIWGEALTTRVGDVIHPDDSRFCFTFANLEDTRIPSWMVRGIHDISILSSSFEWIVNPNIVQNKYRVSRVTSNAQVLPTGIIPGERFGIYPEDRGITPFYIPAFGVREEYPGTWKNLRGGFRTNTTIRSFNFGFTYFHTQEYNPVLKYGNMLVPYTPILDNVIYIPGVRQNFILSHPNKDIFGFYMNKQLPWPGVIRAELIDVPNQPFTLLNPEYGNGVVRRNYVKYMIAYDLSSFLYFSWHKTASFDITFEHVGEWIPNNKGLQYLSFYQTELRSFNPSFNMSIGTNWRYNQIATTLIIGYSPWGNSGLLMPIVKYTPPIPMLNSQLSFELRYINVFARTPYKGLGILRTKDMLVLTTQLDW